MKRIWLFGVAAAIVSSGQAAAQPYHGVGFAGGTHAGADAGAYAGAVVALPGGELGRGLALRASLNAGRYEYVTNGFKVEAQYRGAETALVYQTSGRWGWANLSAGPRLATLELSPRDPGNDRRGTRLDLGFQADGALELKEWRLNWLGSLTVRDRAYLTQIAAGRVVETNREIRLGAEASLQGDERYTKLSAGPFASSRLGGDLTGRIAAGLSDQKGRKARPYLSAGMTLLF